MDTVKPAHHVAVHHVNHGFRHGIIDAFPGHNPLLQQHILGTSAGLRVLQGMRQLGHAASITHRHDTHAAASVIGLDHHIRLFLDAVFLVLALDLGQQRVDLARQAVAPGRRRQIHRTTAIKQRINQPRVNTEQFA